MQGILEVGTDYRGGFQDRGRCKSSRGHEARPILHGEMYGYVHSYRVMYMATIFFREILVFFLRDLKKR